jgi:hypothetical protein
MANGEEKKVPPESQPLPPESDPITEEKVPAAEAAASADAAPPAAKESAPARPVPEPAAQPEPEERPALVRAAYEHPLPIRITHWVNALAFIPGHLIMVVLHGWSNFFSMLSGWKREPEYQE